MMMIDKSVRNVTEKKLENPDFQTTLQLRVRNEASNFRLKFIPRKLPHGINEITFIDRNIQLTKT